MTIRSVFFYDGAMLKNVGKFLFGAIAIVAVGVGVLFAIDYLRYQKSPEYQAQKEAEQIKKEYAEDPYGGDTPEETLRLFIDALKQGDTDLAAKYFVLDKQEQWREDLSQIQEKGLLDEMVRDLEREKERKDIGDDKSNVYIYNNENILAINITLIKNQGGKWKLQDL